MKKNLILVLMMALLVFTVGCSAEPQEDATAVTESESTQKESSESKDSEAVQETPVEEKDTLFVGQTFVTSGLDPANGSAGWALTTHGISENLFTVNQNGQLVSRLVESLEQVDDNTWSLSLKEGLHFSDGSPLTAEDVAGGLNRTNESNGAAQATVGSITYTAEDTLTMTIVTERPTKILKSILAEWANAVYKVNEDESIVFTGPFMIANHTPNEQLALDPNPYYPQADERRHIVIKAIKDKMALKMAFESGELDMAFPIPSELAQKLEADGHIIKGLDAGYQYFGFLNLENPILTDLEVRQALNMAIDRDQLIEALHGGNVPTGAFAHYFPFAGEGEMTADLEKAKAILEAQGWTLNADGIREKDGTVLSLKVVTYPQRPDLVTMSHVINSQLKQLGVDVEVEISENIGSVAKEGAFDLMLYAQHTAPTGEPSFFLNQVFRSNGPNNYANYKSEAFDTKLDELGASIAEDDVIKAAVEAQAILMEDLPVLFLVDPQWHVGLSQTVENYEPWGADYHIIRQDLGL